MMLFGVSSSLRIGAERANPSIAMRSDAMSIRYALLTMTFLTLCSSLAPKYFEAAIPLPFETPIQNEKNKKDSEPVEPTAASASAPTKRPTIAESARLYSC